MEKVKITSYDHDVPDEDFDELNLLINGHTVETHSYMHPTDERAVYLRIDSETEEVIGAMILWANDWLAELADAFKRRDLTHPDVRFFFEQKIKAFAAQWVAEPHAKTLAPSSPEDWRVAPVDEPAPAINQVAETQPA